MKAAQMNDQSGWGLTEEDLDKGETHTEKSIQLYPIILDDFEGKFYLPLFCRR
jgi:hypothetical protein